MHKPRESNCKEMRDLGRCKQFNPLLDLTKPGNLHILHKDYEALSMFQVCVSPLNQYVTFENKIFILWWNAFW